MVRGLVRRVVRGVGSVGSPRSGGQFFQLSPIFLLHNSAVMEVMILLVLTMPLKAQRQVSVLTVENFSALIV